LQTASLISLPTFAFCRLPPQDTLPSIRARLLAAHRTSVLHRDEQGQAMYLNLLLRNFLTPSSRPNGELSLVEQADKLRSQTTFPDSASNNQVRRDPLCLWLSVCLPSRLPACLFVFSLSLSLPAALSACVCRLCAMAV
jgi:hypothetical protein